MSSNDGRTRESVDRAEIVRRIIAGPAPVNEATGLIGAMVAIIEAKVGLPAAKQVLEALIHAPDTIHPEGKAE